MVYSRSILPLVGIGACLFSLCIKVSIANEIQIINVAQEFLSVNLNPTMLLDIDEANYTETALGMRWLNGR